jgi:hypothetical protein
VDADRLIRALCAEIGRHGQCGTLNPALGYCLRQKGMSTIMITGDLRCHGAPIEHMETGYHLWNLVSDGRTCWHVDAANHFLTSAWYRDHLSPERWNAVARGKETGPPIPIEPGNFVLGSLSSYGVVLEPASVSALAPSFDVLEQVGKKDAVRRLFHEHQFEDPYEFPAGTLDLTGVCVPT